MTGDGSYPMNPERYGGGVDRADFVVPMRECCSSRLNEFHVEECMNASLNEKWKALGVIVDHGAAGLGVSVYDLSGEPMPVRLAASRTWGVRIPVTTTGEWAAHIGQDGPPPNTAASSGVEGDSREYRDLSTVFSAENARIRPAADKLLSDLGIRESVYWETYHRVAEFFIANLILLHERNEAAHDAWRRVGYLGNLLTLWGKVGRLMNALWWFPKSELRREKPLDHFGDSAVYSAFCAIQFMVNEEKGSER